MIEHWRWPITRRRKTAGGITYRGNNYPRLFKAWWYISSFVLMVPELIRMYRERCEKCGKPIVRHTTEMIQACFGPSPKRA